MFIKGAYHLARLQIARGRLVDLPELNQLAQRTTPYLALFAAALQARLCLLAVSFMGDAHYMAAAESWAGQQQFKVEEAQHADWYIYAHLVHAQVLLGQHRFGQRIDLHPALDYLPRQLPYVESWCWARYA